MIHVSLTLVHQVSTVNAMEELLPLKSGVQDQAEMLTFLFIKSL